MHPPARAATGRLVEAEQMDALRIFISSPGDVAEERERARQVVQGLRRRYARHFGLMPIVWEDMPLSADASFQQGIDLVLSRDRGIDIAVFILWSRMGSPPGAVIRRQDGREYRSGTERELDLMLAARQAQGGTRPHILAYTRQDEAAFTEALRGRPRTEQDELLRQKQMVEQFIREEFHDRETGANLRAYHTFVRPQSFAERLRVHLQEILDGLCADRPTRAVWDIDTKGPPFRGLEAFRVEHAEIFCGREDEVAEARARLGEAARRGTAFLLVGGASGTGKSSLAAAGLVPEIVAHETDETVGRWLHAVFTPAALGGDPADGMARILVHAVPTLVDRCSPADLATSLGRDPTLAVQRFLLPALDAAAVPGAGGVRLVLLVDQLEEVFSDPRLDEHERAGFAAILRALATSGSVWVVATLRADWYPRLLECPALVTLKDSGAQLDLVPPGVDAVRRMIESPAVLSGLAYERAGTTSLGDRIMRDVADRAELLPVLEDLLRELFERRTDAGLLTVAAYETLGGIEGSLANRAETALASLPMDVQLTLPAVLRALVTITDGADATPVRRRALLASFSDGSPARRLVERLVADRLATAAADDQGRPTVTIAHEAIVRIWPRAAAWIRDNAEFLRARDRLAARMKERAPLSAGDPLLPTARAILATQRDALDPDLTAYVAGQVAAIEADRHRRERSRRAVMAGLVTLALAASITAGAALWQWREATRAQMAAVTARDTAVTSRHSAEGLVEYMTFDLQDKLRPIGRLDLMKDVLQKLDAYHDERIRLEEAGREETTPEDLRRRAVFFGSLSELARASGDLDAARTHAERALAVAETLAGQDRTDDRAQLDVATSHVRLGTVAAAAGDFATAREYYAKGLGVGEDVVARSPENDTARWTLIAGHNNLGNLATDMSDLAGAREHYEKALAIAELLVSRDPGDTEAQLTLELCLTNVGNLSKAEGDLTALQKYQDKAHAIADMLAVRDPRNASLRHDLAMSHRRLGDFAAATGDRARAQEHYVDGVRIVEALVTDDPLNAAWRWDLAIGYSRLGDLACEAGDRTAAREHYGRVITILEVLTAQDPDNSQWQRDLAISHTRVGDLDLFNDDHAAAREHYEAAVVVMERLTVLDPHNAGWRRDLAIGHCGLGDIARSVGDLTTAIAHYEKDLAIVAALAAEDPANARARWDVSVVRERLGDLASRTGDLDAARKHHEQAFGIRETLVAQDPANDAWSRGLFISCGRLGRLAQDRQDWAEARARFLEQLAIADRLFPDEQAADAVVFRMNVLRPLSECHRKLGDDEAAQACEALIAELQAAGNATKP